MTYESDMHFSGGRQVADHNVSGKSAGARKSGESTINGPSGQFSKFSDIGKLADGTGGKGRQSKSVGYHEAD